MEHDGANIETISNSANSHEIRTLGVAPTAYLAMRRKASVVAMVAPDRWSCTAARHVETSRSAEAAIEAAEIEFLVSPRVMRFRRLAEANILTPDKRAKGRG
jgi:hypothetical protein